MEKATALVTGGSRGIGAGICKRLAHDGYHVLVNFSANEQKAQAIVNEIISNGGSASLCGFDVSNPDQVDDAFARILKDFGPIEVLVNNAGINRDGLLVRMKNEDLDNILNTNLKGAIYCSRAAAKQMMKTRKGSIILISSVVGQTGNAGQSAYSAAKAGMIGFAKSTAQELASRKIRVNVIAPGFVQTDMTEALTEDQKEVIVQKIPLGFIGNPEDIAGAVSYLASNDSRYITGEVLSVNGGMAM